jgi:phage terminase large subunit
MQLTSRAQFPAKLRPLFEPKRYKVLRGGRGGAKSWGIARALIQKAAHQRLDWLCAREYQSSVRDSVHKLLKGQIEGMGLSSLFGVERDVIHSPHGGSFVFVGLSDKTAENLKSYEDFDGCWVEEAQVMTDRSLQMLTPTIRKPGSEIWFSYNPELDSDPIERFAESLLPEEGIVIDVNWRDNPWFTPELEAERQRALRTLSKVEYEWIWEGKRRPAVSGAIYADEMAALLEQRRLGDFPYDPFHLVYPVFDLGWNDHMVIGFWQRNISQLRLIDYMEVDHTTLDNCSRELRSRPYSYGKVFLPHDGDHGDYRSDQGKSAKQILEGLRWTVEVLPKRGIEEGIRETRMALKQAFVDRTKCASWAEHMKRYRRVIPKTTNEPGAPLHDVHSHCADMTRYAAQAAPMMDDETGMNLPPLKYGKSGLI